MKWEPTCVIGNAMAWVIHDVPSPTARNHNIVDIVIVVVDFKL